MTDVDFGGIKVSSEAGSLHQVGKGMHGSCTLLARSPVLRYQAAAWHENSALHRPGTFLPSSASSATAGCLAAYLRHAFLRLTCFSNLP